MKILSFLAHTKYFSDLSLTGNTIFLIESDPVAAMLRWNSAPYPKADTVFFVTEADAQKRSFDVAVANSVDQVSYFRERFNNLPLIYLCHGTAPATSDCDVIVTASRRNLRQCEHPKQVIIPLCGNPNVYYGYTGEINHLITVANNIAERPELQKALVDKVVAGYDHSYIGSGNDGLPNGLRFMSFEKLRYILRYFRGMVYTASKECSMCFAVGEALMTGMPVCLSDFGDWGDYIENRVSGMVSDDPNELRDFCLAITKSRAYAMSVGAAGREVMLNNFSIDVFITGWNCLLNEFA